MSISRRDRRVVRVVVDENDRAGGVDRATSDGRRIGIGAREAGGAENAERIGRRRAAVGDAAVVPSVLASSRKLPATSTVSVPTATSRAVDAGAAAANEETIESRSW